jgi:hypothetical protein
MLSATVNAVKSAQICPKLPKTAKICQNLPKYETLKFRQKSRFQCFSKIKNFMCRGGTRTCFHRLDFQSKNFSYAIFIVKKWPLYVNFCIPLCGKYFFWQPSTPLVNMRFCTHVPNSTMNKNLRSGKPYRRRKMVFLASKTLLSLSGTLRIYWICVPDEDYNAREMQHWSILFQWFKRVAELEKLLVLNFCIALR